MGLCTKRKCFKCLKTFCVLVNLFSVVTVIAVVSSDSGRRTIRLIREGVDCSDYESIQFIHDTCTNYTKGLISGSFCPKLCSEGSVKYVRCLGHDVKPHVLLMKYKGSDVILKAKRAITSSTVRHKIKSFRHLLGSKDAVDFKDFKTFTKRAIREVMFDTDEHDVNDAVLDELARECDGNKDEMITLDEASSCLRIIASEEYLYYVMLRGTVGMPQAYGTCGNSFAVESFSSADMEDHLLKEDHRSWSKRVRIAIGLIEMVMAFEHTPYGTIYLCDVKESNFGVKTLPNGTVQVAAIDMDISFFESVMKETVLAQAKWDKKNCSSHSDCDFIHCWSYCNHETSRCDNKLYSSNIQLLCNQIFESYGATDPGLLHNPPEEVEEELEELLDKCSHPRHLIRYSDEVLVRSPPAVMEAMIDLLKESLQY